MSERSLRDRSSSVVRASRWAMSIFVVIITMSHVLEELIRILTGKATWAESAYVILLISVLVLALLWIVSSQLELNLLFEILKSKRYRPPSDMKESLIIIGVAVMIALLMAVAKFIHVFASLYFYYLLIDHVSWVYRLREIKLAVEDARSQTREDLLNPIVEYYFSRPHLLRVSLMIACSFPLAIIAWHGHLENAQRLKAIASAGFAGIILVGELPLYVWRQRFQSDIRAAQMSDADSEV